MDTSNAPHDWRLLLIRRTVSLSRALRSHPAWPLALGGLLITGAVGVFADLAEDVHTADHVTIVDLQLANWLHAHGTPQLTRVMLAVSLLHGMLAISLLTVLLALFLRRRSERDWLVSLLLVIPGGLALNTLLKHAFARARPHFTDPIVTLATYSFPSGHVAGSTLLYGFVAAGLVSRTDALAWQLAIVGGALLMVGLVAASRV
jgi:membrane-associated phospholipid phosphatase